MNCLIVKLQNRMKRDAKVRRRKNRRSGISCHSYANSLFTVHKISVVYKSSVRFRRSAFYIHSVFFWLPSEFYFCSYSTDSVRVCVIGFSTIPGFYLCVARERSFFASFSLVASTMLTSLHGKHTPSMRRFVWLSPVVCMTNISSCSR